jgi:hypothetical protein
MMHDTVPVPAIQADIRASASSLYRWTILFVGSERLASDTCPDDPAGNNPGCYSLAMMGHERRLPHSCHSAWSLASFRVDGWYVVDILGGCGIALALGLAIFALENTLGGLGSRRR